MFKFSTKSLERMHGVDECLVVTAHRALELSRIDFGIPPYGGKRTQEEQYQLWADNKSSCDGVVDISKHQYGKALDVYAYVDGKASWEPYHLAMIAAAMLQAATEYKFQIEWGGLWKYGRWAKQGDMGHFQLK